MVFHAATKTKNHDILSDGGRVIAVTSKGKDLETALRKVYFDVEKIDFESLKSLTSGVTKEITE